MTTTITEIIKVKLGDEALLERAYELTEALTDLEQLKSDWIDRRRCFAGEVKELEDDIKRLSNVIETGTDDLPVEVRVNYDHPRVGQKTFFRVDTGDDLRTEDMTEEEMQTELPL
jgi:hypothetical protein